MNTPPSFALGGFLYSAKTFPLAGCWRLVKRKQGQKKRQRVAGARAKLEIQSPYTPASAGAQQTLPAVPSLTRVAMGPDVRNVNADHSNANITQLLKAVNCPAGLIPPDALPGSPPILCV